jgi:hypothetical protein
MSMKAVTRFAPVLALALTALGCDFLEYGPGGDAKEAETRVLHVLASMQKAGDTTSLDLQEGICRWYNGKRLIGDAMEMEAALTASTAGGGRATSTTARSPPTRSPAPRSCPTAIRRRRWSR